MNIEKRAFNLKPASINEEDRTVQVVWTSGASVKRYGFDGSEYIEKLVVNDSSVDLERLNNGAPLLNTHRSNDLNDIVGVVESAWIERGKGYAVVKISERAQAIWNDIKNGIIRNISVGYSIDEFDDFEENGMRIISATRWTPVELSLVPVPADAEAQTRSAEEVKTADVEVSEVVEETVEESVETQETTEVVEVSEETEATEENNGADVDAVAETAEITENIEVVEIPQEEQQDVEVSTSVDGIVVVETEAVIEEAAPSNEAPAEEVEADKTPEVAESDVRAVSAQIVRRCEENGMIAMAPEFIEKGFSLDEVERQINELTEIRTICKRAGFEKLTDDFIARKVSVDEVRKELFEKLVSRDNETAINSGFSDEISNEELKRTERQKRLNPQNIYKLYNTK